MTLLRKCCWAGLVTATCVAPLAAIAQDQSPADAPNRFRQPARDADAIQPGQSIAWKGEVLRQQVSVPLERLMQPTTLADWIRGPAGLASPTEPAPWVESVDRRATATAAESLGDPFADDSQPPATATDAAAQPDGKIPSGKLFGILGRVLRQTAPLPSLEGLRQQLPPLGVPVPGAAGESPDADGGAGSEGDFAPADEDPFGAPASEPAGATDNDAATDPADAATEDPFGGF